ncbi:hypothetical protein COL77_30440 [Bacillus wiedmannii]|uniref:hypothetical protein n=1 Tax=Bacillus wiedmannii TaxID=1890302 RepID=UPI000BF9F362|nr:hypothetical protein [Bacillus wiedmannii]PFZ33840.1 hypothetical protein COL77_30440 [Bacillus wiedmannii]
MGVFKIIHRCNENYDKHSIFVKTNIDNLKLCQIIACIQFKYEELVDQSGNIDEQHLLEILTNFYEIEDVTKEFLPFLPYTQMEISNCEGVDLFAIYNAYDEIHEFRHMPINQRELYIIQIDQWYVRELCCPNASKLMKQRLPNSKDFDKAITHSKVKL